MSVLGILLRTRQGVLRSRWSCSSRFASDAKVKLDPFGIEDIENPDRLVQGFYGREERGETSENVTAEAPAAQAPPNTEVSTNLKKYDEWLQQRKLSDAMEKAEGSISQSLRHSRYGNIRLDSDNIVQEHGQYDDDTWHSPTKKYLREEQQKDDTEENEQAKEISAAEYLKKVKQNVKEKKGASPVVITVPTRSPLFKRKSAEEERQEKLETFVDSKISKIPSIYELPRYNKLTKSDMWSILKHTKVFENEFVYAINKPAGVPMHSPSINCRHFISEFLEEFAKLAKVEAIHPLHRLDKETSGVLLFAKDLRIAKYIKEKFAQRQVEKKYLAITKGCPQVEEGTIKIPIGDGKVGGLETHRSVLKPDLTDYNIPTKQTNCRNAVTHFRIISSTDHAAFLEVVLETGVKHQIRVHLGLGLGTPIIGDHKYSHRDRFAPQRLNPQLLRAIKVRQSKVRELPLHLHCSSISFRLPDGAIPNSVEPLYAHALVPNYFKHSLRAFGLKV